MPHIDAIERARCEHSLGDRVMCFNPRLYKNDIDTPLSVTVQPATIMAIRLSWSPAGSRIVHDVHFDGDSSLSRSPGHYSSAFFGPA